MTDRIKKLAEKYYPTVEEVEKILDIIVANEGEPDVIQISGGEPTIHPDFFTIFGLIKTMGFASLLCEISITNIL